MQSAESSPKKHILSIDFFVSGVPYAKQSARVTKNGFIYQSKNVKAWQKVIREAAKDHYKGAVVDEALKIRLDFLTKREADIDNLAKAVLDGLEGVIFLNDRKVVSLTLTKTLSDGVYGVRVRLTNVLGAYTD